MSWQVVIMYAVAATLGLVGTAMLLRLRSPRISEGQTYAFRMVGIMLTSGGLVLAMSASAMHSWSSS